jgi:nitrogen-specific signal transduction histidine kinase
LEVDDEGPGLPPEIRQRLFTPHLSTKANGSGMGLFLAHRIAGNRYGGRLELLDLEPTGTRAVLELRDRVDGLATSPSPGVSS